MVPAILTESPDACMKESESSESQGSTFHFTLPLSPVPGAPVGE